jgi:hypothetical protein
LTNPSFALPVLQPEFPEHGLLGQNSMRSEFQLASPRAATKGQGGCKERLFLPPGFSRFIRKRDIGRNAAGSAADHIPVFHGLGLEAAVGEKEPIANNARSTINAILVDSACRVSETRFHQFYPAAIGCLDPLIAELRQSLPLPIRAFKVFIEGIQITQIPSLPIRLRHTPTTGRETVLLSWVPLI